MNTAEPLYYLNRLHKILNWSDSRIEFFYGIPWLYQLAVALMLWITVILTPYVIYLLFRLKKWGWLVYFCVITGIGLLAGAAGSGFGLQFYLSTITITLLLVVFMWSLRLRVNEWRGLAQFEQEMRRERLMKQKAAQTQKFQQRLQ
ncbi:MAG: hypothetical protein EA364_06825 [Balneolaceae bacterium]|nr:MAG: hypothetical protein EA364_06825 [Balneolaceae bacterium]